MGTHATPRQSTLCDSREPRLERQYGYLQHTGGLLCWERYRNLETPFLPARGPDRRFGFMVGQRGRIQSGQAG